MDEKISNQSGAKSAGGHSFGQDKKNKLVCTACKKLKDSKVLVPFTETDFNMTNKIVMNALSTRHIMSDMKEFICNVCFKLLTCDNPKMPHSAPLGDQIMECVVCDNEYNCSELSDFHTENYNSDSALLKRVISSQTYKANKSMICKKCHINLLRHSMETCTMCLKQVKRYAALILRQPMPADANGPGPSTNSSQRSLQRCHVCQVRFSFIQ